MPVSSVHPFYDDQVEDWIDSRVAIAGERAVRADIQRYLPVPPGMGQPAARTAVPKHGVSFQQHDRYSWYATFADYPEIVAPTVEAFQGLIHEKKPRVDLPSQMEYLREKATANGESLDELWKMVTRELISSGRQVLLGEVLPGTDRVVSCPYHAESLINWQISTPREGSVVSLAVLAEGSFRPSEDDEFETDLVTQYRELRMIQGKYAVRLWESETDVAQSGMAGGGKTVQQSTEVLPSLGEPTKVTQPEQDANGFLAPQRLGQAFDFIPIDVGNADGIGFTYGHIPILPMAKLALAIFRKSADYNRALYNKGDPQAYIAADMAEEDLPTTVGGSELWLLPQGGKADFLDINGDGIPLMRDAIRDLFDRFVQEAGRFLETQDKVNPNESGRAVEKRLSAQRVTLRSLVIEAGRLMEKHLRTIGKMLGLDEASLQQIKFEPNMDFTELKLSGQELLQLISAKNMGAPLSQRSLHRVMGQGGLTDMTFEEEQQALTDEQNLLGPPPTSVLATSTTDDHRHLYTADADTTEMADGHAHPIEDGVIMPANGHTHAADIRAAKVAAPPDAAGPAGGPDPDGAEADAEDGE
ncbi:MAG TPA: DUF4055 domain-containing protein [Candidatus Limnocylindria bacterium]|nr:DUF4055 domain-containing protein [Candidatus Limnocylindria bacterium]